MKSNLNIGRRVLLGTAAMGGAAAAMSSIRRNIDAPLGFRQAAAQVVCNNLLTDSVHWGDVADPATSFFWADASGTNSLAGITQALSPSGNAVDPLPHPFPPGTSGALGSTYRLQFNPAVGGLVAPISIFQLLPAGSVPAITKDKFVVYSIYVKTRQISSSFPSPSSLDVITLKATPLTNGVSQPPVNATWNCGNDTLSSPSPPPNSATGGTKLGTSGWVRMWATVKYTKVTTPANQYGILFELSMPPGGLVEVFGPKVELANPNAVTASPGDYCEAAQAVILPVQPGP